MSTVLDHRGGTLNDLLEEVDMARVDRLAARFRKCAMRAQPITAVEVMTAALQIMGETALQFIANADQRRLVFSALAGHLVGPESERLR